LPFSTFTAGQRQPSVASVPGVTVFTQYSSSGRARLATPRLNTDTVAALFQKAPTPSHLPSTALSGFGVGTRFARVAQPVSM
jgi:hypothetical protein